MIGVTMNFPPKDSPFWPIARSVVVGTFLCAFLALNYHNGWSANDWVTLIGVLTPMGIFDAIKRFVAGDGQQ
ncbi:MAG: hypothetical protein EBW87_01735 [Burkholderiaceae bacterium]|nr:hypothetical protein [Burkholderiaceae bacterium]